MQSGIEVEIEKISLAADKLQSALTSEECFVPNIHPITFLWDRLQVLNINTLFIGRLLMFAWADVRLLGLGVSLSEPLKSIFTSIINIAKHSLDGVCPQAEEIEKQHERLRGAICKLNEVFPEKKEAIISLVKKLKSSFHQLEDTYPSLVKNKSFHQQYCKFVFLIELYFRSPEEYKKTDFYAHNGSDELIYMMEEMNSEHSVSPKSYFSGIMSWGSTFFAKPKPTEPPALTRHCTDIVLNYFNS